MQSRVKARRRETCRPSAQPWLLIALLSAIVAGCDFPGRPNPDDRPVPSDQVVTFEVVFREQCAGCHGANGQFGPAPPLNDPLFLAIVPGNELLGTIRDGRPGTPMPAFTRNRGGPLTDAQVKALADGLKPRWGRATLAKDLLPAYAMAKERNTTSAAESVERGAKTFAQACAECHGSRGQGSDKGAGAVNDRAFLSLISDQALRRIIITGRPDLGMPDFSEKMGRPSDFKPLTSSEIADLVALLASWRRGDVVPDKAFAAEKAEGSKPPQTN
jgi:mono/diheme cytochrome c family protein